MSFQSTYKAFKVLVSGYIVESCDHLLITFTASVNKVRLFYFVVAIIFISVHLVPTNFSFALFQLTSIEILSPVNCDFCDLKPKNEVFLWSYKPLVYSDSDSNRNWKLGYN